MGKGAKADSCDLSRTFFEVLYFSHQTKSRTSEKSNHVPNYVTDQCNFFFPIDQGFQVSCNLVGTP